MEGKVERLDASDARKPRLSPHRRDRDLRSTWSCHCPARRAAWADQDEDLRPGSIKPLTRCRPNESVRPGAQVTSARCSFPYKPRSPNRFFSPLLKPGSLSHWVDSGRSAPRSRRCGVTVVHRMPGTIRRQPSTAPPGKVQDRCQPSSRGALLLSRSGNVVSGSFLKCRRPTTISDRPEALLAVSTKCFNCCRTSSRSEFAPCAPTITPGKRVDRLSQSAHPRAGRSNLNNRHSDEINRTISGKVTGMKHRARRPSPWPLPRTFPPDKASMPAPPFLGINPSFSKPETAQHGRRI